MSGLSNKLGAAGHSREDAQNQEFCHHLIQHSQRRRTRVLYVGSMSEIHGQDLIFKQSGLNVEEIIDKDMMTINNERFVIPHMRTVPEHLNDTVTVFRIYSKGHHPGYVKLHKEGDNTELTFSDITKTIIGVRHGPANMFSTKSIGEHLVQRYSRISIDSFKANRGNRIIDDVHAVHSPYWPLEAGEWITRQRPSGFPSKSIIRKVIQYGCDFVPVSHRFSSDNNEWRFSFSIAELIIINNWTISQRIVYRMLHIISKMIRIRNKNSVLCTYYCKTLMLWATETRPAEFWFEDALVNSTFKLLNKLKECLEKKYFQNYFIPGNNIIDHLINADLSADIEALREQLQVADPIIVNGSRFAEFMDNNSTYHIEAQIWRCTNPIIDEQIVDINEVSTCLFSKKIPNLVQNAISFQLSDIYSGLKCQQKLSNCIVQHNKEYFGLNFVTCFESLVPERQIITMQRCSKQVAQSLHEHFLQIEQHEIQSQRGNSADGFNRTNALNYAAREIDQKYLLYIRSMDNVDRTTKTDHITDDECITNETIVLHCTSAIDNKIYTDDTFYKEWPGMSPTVNISWFINKAYLANFYCTSTHDYGIAEETCENITSIYRESFFNQRFSERLFPVMISTDWTEVYDEELQAILGLYSLCTFQFYKTDRCCSVCLGVCTVQFALYLKCRCAGDQQLAERWYRYCANYNEHVDQCQGDERVCNGKLAVLTAALRIAGISQSLKHTVSTGTHFGDDALFLLRGNRE